LKNTDDFRKQLNKLLPGYKWTVHRTNSKLIISATGIQSSGFNRLSTLEVTGRPKNPWFEMAGYGYGKRSSVMGRGCGSTLAQAIRGLQDFYAHQKGVYASLELALEEARRKNASEERRLP